MEKLLQLLNEYNKDRNRTEHYLRMNYLVVISKKFWFIQGLVENYKIDIDELGRYWYITKTYDLDELWDWYNYIDWTIMLLSIQDDPIQVLVSILK